MEKIGGWQITGWVSRDLSEVVANGGPRVLSPVHGRSASLHHPEFGHFSIKGIGWTIGPVNVYPSPKDAQLYFGLYSLKDGMREWSVSSFLEAHAVSATRVYGLGTFNPSSGSRTLYYKDGSLVEPALLYVYSISPWRVADLPWMDASTREGVIEEICGSRGWQVSNFLTDFCEHLAGTMARYHRLGCINDSLSPDNVTLAAEITDFEWFTAPGHPLPDGSQAENSSERRRKEALYAYEIGCFLAHGLGKPAHTQQVVSALVAGYRSGDEACAEELSHLLAMVVNGCPDHEQIE